MYPPDKHPNAVRELAAFLNDWREKHNLRNSDARQIIVTVVVEKFSVKSDAPLNK